MPETVVIAGSLAQRPHAGGHAWVFLQYLLGFKQLGWDVLLVDRLEPEMCSGWNRQSSTLEESVNLSYLREVMARYGLEQNYALLWNGGRECLGMSRQRALEKVRSASMLINVMGFLNDKEFLESAKRRVFLDIDPGFSQMWFELGLHDAYRGHDHFVTIGENIGQPECSIPTCGRNWITTRQPVVTSLWPSMPPRNYFCITSVATWRGPFAPIEYRGRTYGLRVHEFRKFAELPRRCRGTFELALDIDPADMADRRRLHDCGWLLVDPLVMTGEPWRYQRYIQRSRAEFMVAKNIYVDTHSGWFSDRSICYLASGRPVIAQNTGLPPELRGGEGLLLYSTLDEAVAAVDELNSDYSLHCQSARDMAETFFDSNVILTRLAQRLLNSSVPC